MFHSIFVSGGVAAIVIALSAAASVADVEPAVPIYNTTVEIDATVDSERYVEQAVVSNTAEGEYKVDFMAEIDSGSGTQERWTILFDKFQQEDQHSMIVSVNGSFKYSYEAKNLDGVPELTVSTTDESGIAIMTDPPAYDSTFIALGSDLSDYRGVAMAVLEATIAELVDGEFPGQPVPEDCSAYCASEHTFPSFSCNENTPFDNWVCCMYAVDHSYCIRQCRCNNQFADPTNCLARAEAIWESNKSICWDNWYEDVLDLAD